ncbi:MAG: Dam family site-specific DNA-(adenine-N6)-methyltransferase [Thermodesulfobacteriota bacterium]
MNNLGQKLRSIRESQELLLRQVASAIEIDQALLSKIERSERTATKNQIIAIANYFEIDERELLTLWLGEKIAYEIKDEEIANDALKVAEKTIQNINNPEIPYTTYNENTEIKFNEPLGLFPNEVSNKPFLKWAGGKTQLIPELLKYIPSKYKNYIEPFVGGGAFFFFLNPNKAIISDSNEELITTYKCVRDNVEDIIIILKNYRNEESFFYRIRALKPELLSDIERAARLIYLNKTCYNGLYRVNKKGSFNVPYGKRNGKFLNIDLLRNASEFLKDTKIIHADYLETLKNYAKKGDFIYLDPPYYPVGKYSDFKRYTKEFFYHNDHILLKEEFDRLVKIGCHVLLTNSNHPVILDLFNEYEIKIIKTKRLISSNTKSRNGEDIIIIGTNV